MRLTQFLLVPILCGVFLLAGPRAFSQSKDNDVLVMEYGYMGALSLKTYGLYIFWPDKDVEYIALQAGSKSEDIIGIKKMLYKKINELSDLGWELDIVDNSSGNYTYFFKRAQKE